MSVKRKNKLGLLWRNIKFLMHVDLRMELGNYAGHRAKLSNLLKGADLLKIRDFEETAELLATSAVSIARYGDGEFAIIEGRGITFQHADANLARRLREILCSPPNNCEIAIPRVGWFMDSRLKKAEHAWWFRFMREKGVFVESLLDPKRTYCDSYVSLFSRATVPEYDVGGMFDRLRQIWAEKDVLIVCGKGIFDGFDYNIFDNARSVEFIYGPKRDAFSDYDALLAQVKAMAKGRLVLIVLGPTATVMAADLAAAGIRALDLGHLAKAYNAFMAGAANDASTRKNFFKAD